MQPATSVEEAEFETSLRLLGQDDGAVRATVALAADRLRMTAGRHEIGEWPLDDIQISRRADGFHLQIEEEELVISIRDSDAFAEAVKLHEPRPAQIDDEPTEPAEPKRRFPRPRQLMPARRPKPKSAIRPATKAAEAPRPAGAKKQEERGLGLVLTRLKGVSWWQWATGGAVLVVVLAAVLATALFAVLLLLTGMVVLLAAGLAASNDQLMYGIVPDIVSETTLVLAGFGLLAGGALLMILA